MPCMAGGAMLISSRNSTPVPSVGRNSGGNQRETPFSATGSPRRSVGASWLRRRSTSLQLVLPRDVGHDAGLADAGWAPEHQAELECRARQGGKGRVSVPGESYVPATPLPLPASWLSSNATDYRLPSRAPIGDKPRPCHQARCLHQFHYDIIVADDVPRAELCRVKVASSLYGTECSKFFPSNLTACHSIFSLSAFPTCGAPYCVRQCFPKLRLRSLMRSKPP